MPSALVHGFEQGWTSTDPSQLEAVATAFRVQGSAGLQLTAHTGAAGAAATFTPAAAVDLSDFDELRLWTWSARVANGSSSTPFLLELSYVDAGDAPGEEHRWLVPANSRCTWEQHSFGIVGDRRNKITAFSLRVLTDDPFVVHLDELLAVREDALSDVEAALGSLLDALPITGVSTLPLQPVAVGATTLVIGLNRLLRAGNRIRVDGETTTYAVTGAVHDQGAGTTTLTIQPPLTAAVGANGTLSVTAPVIFEKAPFTDVNDAHELPDPVLLVALTDQRADPAWSWNTTQRDSFRVRDTVTVCSLRPAPRPVLAEYQIIPMATEHRHSLELRTEILRRIGIDTGLRVNGTVLPVQTILLPPLDTRVRAVPAPIYVRISTRIEQGVRTEVPGVRQGQALIGQLDAPWDPGEEHPRQPPHIAVEQRRHRLDHRGGRPRHRR